PAGRERARPLAHQARIPEQAAQPRQWMLYDTLARALERLIALEHPAPSPRSEQAPRPLERSRERFLARGAVGQHRREGFSEALHIAIAQQLDACALKDPATETAPPSEAPAALRGTA